MMENQGKDRRNTHIPTKFLAGRGRALKELASKPLRAEEVGKRIRLQELILSGSIPLEMTDKVPGGLSQETPKSTNPTGSQYNKRPDPMWTSNRGDECSIDSYGSNSSVETSSLPESPGDVKPAKFETLPPKSETLPPKFETLPPRFETLPPKSETLPPKFETLPPKFETLPPKFEDLPPSVVPGIWKENDWPPLSNGSDKSKQRARRGDLPPRFRNRTPKQSKVPIGQGEGEVRKFASSVNPEYKTAKYNNLRKPAWGLASTKNQDDFPHLGKAEGHPEGPQDTVANPWSEWEESVVIHSVMSEEDMAEIAVIEDNDDISDVIVNHYVNALQEEGKNLEPKLEALQLTPSKIQQLSKLKSTAHADTLKTQPGKIPGPSKKLNRWGGTELQNSNAPMGWGDVDVGGGNPYDDGASAWNTTQSSPGWS